MASSDNSTKHPVIAVDPQAIKTFAANIQALADATGSGSLSEAKMKLKAIDNNMTFSGRGLIPEADSLKNAVVKYAGTAADNIQSFVDGMDKLCADLIVFANKYANADALAKATAQDMWNAIGPDLQTYFPSIVGAQPAPTQYPMPNPNPPK
ncbi:hypothetical protein [Kitasatospora azatica]|uniref:hypothetical protein n=1 Tax=Kitasatospora azatica TaxID=58347 RepID=UPI0012F790A1|nr:hypothetical protein [Kitasatospora azatica]